MKKYNIYDKVKGLLETYPKARNSDKFLMTLVWNDQGLVQKKSGFLGRDVSYFIDLSDFKEKAMTPESITRARRKVQEKYPHLRSTEAVRSKRTEKELMKGNFIFHE